MHELFALQRWSEQACNCPPHLEAYAASFANAVCDTQPSSWQNIMSSRALLDGLPARGFLGCGLAPRGPMEAPALCACGMLCHQKA